MDNSTMDLGKITNTMEKESINGLINHIIKDNF